MENMEMEILNCAICEDVSGNYKTCDEMTVAEVVALREKQQRLVRQAQDRVAANILNSGFSGPLKEFKTLFDTVEEVPNELPPQSRLEDPEPINLNEIIPYRIKAREEHAALMSAHWEREREAKPSIDDVRYDLTDLMDRACGPAANYDPVPEPKKSEVG